MRNEAKNGRIQNDTNLLVPVNGGMKQKILFQEYNLLILTSKMQDNFKIDEKQKITVFVHNTDSHDSNQPQWDGRTKLKN